MTTPRPRRPHAALGARWFSAGLAVAGTVGITSYLEVAAATAAPSGRIELVEPVATTTVPVPPPPEVRVTIVPDATVAPPTTAPRTTAPTTVPPAPRRTTHATTHATTRGSNG